MKGRRAKESDNKLGKLIIVFIIIIGVIVGMFFLGKKRANKVEVEENETNTAEVVSNLVNTTEDGDTKQENQKDDVKNDDESKQETSTTNTEVITEPVEKQEEKAIQIAKKDFGTESGVYYSNMGIDAQGRYIVTVNVSSTTEVIQWYYIDVTTGKFEKQ